LTKEIVLTKKQFELLEYLMSKPNKTLTREDLLNQVWGFDFVGESRTLDVHIKELRRKMQISGIDKTSIETVRSVGYKFVL
jgi:DNA-binding response OmpR family regulator